MMKTLRKLRDMVELVRWATPAMWRVMNGRWHVWRDAPSRVVNAVATAPMDGDSRLPVNLLVMQAREERYLRMLQEIRGLKASPSVMRLAGPLVDELECLVREEFRP